MKHYIRNSDNKGHTNKVHFVDNARLTELLDRLASR